MKPYNARFYRVKKDYTDSTTTFDELKQTDFLNRDDLTAVILFVVAKLK